MLPFRRTGDEQPLDSLRPEPIIDDPAVGTDPEHEVLLADSVGIALQVVLDTLSPAERLAFVLHDMFAVPFNEIAAMVDRSPEATRQLELHGAARVARGAMTARRFAPYVRPALVNGAAGAVAFDGERPFAVLAFTVVGDRAVAIDVFNDPELVAKLDTRGITA